MNALRCCTKFAVYSCSLLAALAAPTDSMAPAKGMSAAPPWTTIEQPSPSWGNVTGFAPAAEDSRGREGRWWWPKRNSSDYQGGASLGNGGRVFGPWKAPEAPAVTVYDPPLPQKSDSSIPNPNLLKEEPNRLIVIENVYFDVGSVVLNDNGKQEIQRHVDRMKRFTEDSVVCLGHTDDIGTSEQNMRLGELRASAAKDYFVQCGIDEGRVRVASKGETDPAVPNNTPQNRALNRRVTFEITLGN
jgi:outer membrane protein OmpA-like peptidoglycan-associated protein